jgi:hypothetical protein
MFELALQIIFIWQICTPIFMECQGPHSTDWLAAKPLGVHDLGTPWTKGSALFDTPKLLEYLAVRDGPVKPVAGTWYPPAGTRHGCAGTCWHVCVRVWVSRILEKSCRYPGLSAGTHQSMLLWVAGRCPESAGRHLPACVDVIQLAKHAVTCLASRL